MQPEPPTPSGGTTPLRPRADITKGLPRHDAVLYCPSCWAYRQPPATWVRREPRSWMSTTPGTANDVARIHLDRVRRHIAGLGLTIAAARSFSTTACPRRFYLHLRLRRGHEAGTEPQAHVVELTSHDRLCDACSRSQADPDRWPAVVQVRQRASTSSSCRRTLNHVMSLLVCYRGNDSLLRVDWDAGAGVLDVHVVSRAHAARFVRFVSTVAPARVVGTARRLVSRDGEGSPYRLHFISVDICPVCEDDLVLLHAEASRALGRLGPLVLCIKVTSSLALLDTGNMRVVVVGVEACERFRIQPLLGRGRLVEYVVLGVQHDPSGHVAALGASFMMSWAQVVRSSDVGKKDAAVITVKTHLGYDLEPGCHALGYDLSGDDVYGHGLEKYGKRHTLPAAVLTRRYYDDDEDWEESAGGMQDGREGRRGGGGIEEVTTGIGCMDLNPADDKNTTVP